MEDISTLSLKELKALITKAGLSFADCIDKSDLRARASEAQDRLSATATSKTSGSGTPAGERAIAGYSCIVKGPSDLIDGSGGAPADLVFICLHGLGASNTDFSDVLPMLAKEEPALGTARVVQVFPQAPMSELGAAWWQFNVMKFMQASMGQDQTLMAELIREKPQGLDACRKQMAEMIEEARRIAGGSAGLLASSKVMLAGFSLGAITALDVALQRPEGEGLAAVLFMNGAPIVVDEWAARLKVHPGLRVLQTGGQIDMTLPVMCSHWVKDLLTKNGADVTLKVHQGGHEIGPPDIVKAIATFVRSAL